MDRRRNALDRIVAWSPVLLLGALAALTYWLDAQVQAPSARRDGSSRHDPDLFLQDFKAITFDAQGRPRETLFAARAEHFPDDDSAELTKPSLALSETGQPTLTITADRGKMDGDRNQGDFIGNVRVERVEAPANGADGGSAKASNGDLAKAGNGASAKAGNGDSAKADNGASARAGSGASGKANDVADQGPVKLFTESLHVTTRDQRVQTDRAVTIQDPRGIIRGKGLEFDNKSKTVRLNSNVSGTFQPQDISK